MHQATSPRELATTRLQDPGIEEQVTRSKQCVSRPMRGRIDERYRLSTRRDDRMQIWRVSRSLEVLSTGSLPTNIKVGNEGEITQMKSLLLHSWIREEDVSYLTSVLLTRWARRTKENDFNLWHVWKDFATAESRRVCLLRGHLQCR